MFRPTEDVKNWVGDVPEEDASTNPSFRTYVLSKTSEVKILALHPIDPIYLKLLSRPEKVELANKVASDIRSTQPDTPQAATISDLKATLQRLVKLGVNLKKKKEQPQTPPEKGEGSKAITATTPEVEDESNQTLNNGAEGEGSNTRKRRMVDDGSENTDAPPSKRPAVQQGTLSGIPTSILKRRLSATPGSSNETTLPNSPRALKDINSPIKDKTMSLSAETVPTPKELARDYRKSILSRFQAEHRHELYLNSVQARDATAAQGSPST